MNLNGPRYKRKVLGVQSGVAFVRLTMGIKNFLVFGCAGLGSGLFFCLEGLVEPGWVVQCR